MLRQNTNQHMWWNELVHLCLVNIQFLFPSVILEVSMKGRVFSYCFCRSFWKLELCRLLPSSSSSLKICLFHLRCRTPEELVLWQDFQLSQNKEFNTFCVFNVRLISSSFLGILLLKYSRIVIFFNKAVSAVSVLNRNNLKVKKFNYKSIERCISLCANNLKLL